MLSKHTISAEFVRNRECRAASTTAHITTSKTLSPESQILDPFINIVSQASQMEYDCLSIPSLSQRREQNGRSWGALTKLYSLIEDRLFGSSKETEECVEPIGSPLTEETRRLVLLSIKSWLDVFFIYGFEFNKHSIEVMLSAVLNTYEKALEVTLASGWISYFKYRNASFFSAWNNQVQPPRPTAMTQCNDKYLFGGPFYKFTRKVDREGKMRSFSLSILQSKKGMPRPSDQQVREAEIKSFTTMTTKKEVVPWESPLEESMWVPFDKTFVKREIARTTDELLKGWKPDLESLTKIFLPSASSNYNRTRKEIGTYGELEDLEIFNEFKKSAQGKLRYTAKMSTLAGYVSDYYGREGIEDQERYKDLMKSVPGLEVETGDFLQSWKTFYWKCVHLAVDESPVVSVVGLKEALKIRCISKGPPLTYFVLKPLQKSLWKHLQRKKTFELTGTPVTEELMNERFGTFIGQRMHSGDYSAATDELHSFCSNAVCDGIFKKAAHNLGYGLGPLEELFKRALTGHIYEDPTDDQVFVTQKRGQLMGSIISFPVLCIANVTLIRVAYEWAHGVKTPIHKLPCWINGDDCLTAYTNNNFPIYWRGIGSVMGFTESVGKTYDSTEFCSINSNTFQVLDGSWKLVPYVNLGLIDCGSVSVNSHSLKTQVNKQGNGKGKSQKIKKAKPPHLMSLGVCHRQLLDSLPASTFGTDIRERVNELFIRKHGDRMKEFHGEWFLPIWLGGLGLRKLTDYTDSERSYAAYAKIAIGLGLEAPVYKTDKEWVHYDMYVKFIHQKEPMLAKYSFEHYDREEYDTPFIPIIYDQWFEKGLEDNIHKVVLCPEKETLRKSMSFNRVVRRFMEITPIPNLTLCNQDEIDLEPKLSVTPVWAINSN